MRSFLTAEDEKVFFWNAPIAMGVMSPEGKFYRVNHKFVQLIGYSEYEINSKDFTEFTHPVDISGDRESLRAIADKSRDRYQIIKRLITKEQRVIWVRSTTIPLIVDGEIKKMCVWMEELPNHGNFKVEKDGDEVYVRPSITIPKFVIDNWKWFLTLIASSIVALAAGFNTFQKILKFVNSLPDP